MTTLSTNLGETVESVLAFQRDLEARGLADRVLIQLWSEFGRRPRENGSGTDHGAAGVAFLIGKRVKGRMVGEFPGLAKLDPNENTLNTSDFRAMYAASAGAVVPDRSGARDPGRGHGRAGAERVRDRRAADRMSLRARTRPVALVLVLGMLLALASAVASSSLALTPAASHGARAKPLAHRHACAHRGGHATHRARRCPASRRRKAATAAPTTPSPATPLVTAGTGGASAPAPTLSATPLAPALPSQSAETGGTPEGGEVEPPSVPHVQVSAFEWGFSLSRTRVPAGKVVLELVNDGQDEHNLNAAPEEGPLTGMVENTPAKGVRDLTLEMSPGSYTLFCSLPTHEQKGMKATLTVE